MVASSCSITMTVFPKSRNCSSVLNNRALSLWCNPMDGSSRMYKTPINEDPIWVANLILWASPPDSVPAFLSSVKYSSPTETMNPSLSLISLRICFAIIFSFSERVKLSKNICASLTDISVISITDFCPIVTARLSGFNRLPLHTGQCIELM